MIVAFIAVFLKAGYSDANSMSFLWDHDTERGGSM
jgi:hypothetical protein